jgi:hypothetical protein
LVPAGIDVGISSSENPIMMPTRRGLAAAVIALCAAGAPAGCAPGPNEKEMAGTQGTAAADAPKSQADYYAQQQQQAKAGAKARAK